ncbi:MAG: MBL fold metallo-hydrolase [Candidatus Aminicenantes bacterium]|nr:MBL fold metallo-hydrolase [Candidatus Aminicenantes bacterium]
MKIQFLGACQQVTGSCTYLEIENLRLLVDCGMFQERDFLNRNWDPFPISPSSIDYILLTHVHLDHAGLIPRLVHGGFKGKILMTSPSGALLPVVLMDSAKIQEEDVRYKKKRHKKEGRKGPFPVIPLYTMEDAEKSLRLFEEVPYNQSTMLDQNVSVVFHDAGHILGSANVELQIRLQQKKIKMIFSGDIGQKDKPLIKDPTLFNSADYIVMESTYGDRDHEDTEDVEDQLEKIIISTVKSGGNIVIPTFAIERAQELLYHLSRLVRLNRIPYLMMFLDSPMALDITDVFLQSKADMDDETKKLFKEGQSPFRFPGLKFVRSTQESKAINHIRGSCVIMAGSGMCTGGRVKHHLVNNISNSKSTILFVGYQARGTLGRLIVDGREEVRIHGKTYKVKARIGKIDGFSAHADHNGLLKWLDGLSAPPKKIFLVHGEMDAAEFLKNDIVKKKGWKVEIPEYKTEYEIV